MARGRNHAALTIAVFNVRVNGSPPQPHAVRALSLTQASPLLGFTWEGDTCSEPCMLDGA
jgi:hypothetical protein